MIVRYEGYPEEKKYFLRSIGIDWEDVDLLVRVLSCKKCIFIPQGVLALTLSMKKNRLEKEGFVIEE